MAQGTELVWTMTNLHDKKQCPWGRPGQSRAQLRKVLPFSVYASYRLMEGLRQRVSKDVRQGRWRAGSAMRRHSCWHLSPSSRSLRPGPQASRGWVMPDPRPPHPDGQALQLGQHPRVRHAEARSP